MKLWKIYQDVNGGYDVFDAAIVAAETAEEARKIYPGKARFTTPDDIDTFWAPFDSIGCILIGEALPNQNAGVILASFNAG